MSGKGIRRLFRWTACGVVLAALAVALTLIFEEKPEKVRLRPEACPVVSNVIETITHVFAPNGDFIRLDVRNLTCSEFEGRLRGVSDAATLWTPGNGDWLIIGAKNGCTNTLAAAMDAFANEEIAFSFPEVFANCVGTIGEIRAAFGHIDPTDGVVPQLFVTKDIPDFAWLTDGDMDADIVKRTRQEMRSMQVLRRIVLEGEMYARELKQEEAFAKWSAAFRLAPNDTLLLERVHHLLLNAEVFYKVGKYGMACKCYETLLRIKPDDYVAAMNLAECLKRTGQRKLYEAVLKKAESLAPKTPSSGNL